MVVEEEDGLGGAVSPAELAMRKLKLNEKCAILPRVPVVYQMGDCGAFTAEVALSEASTVRELVVEVLRLGRTRVGTKLTPASAVIHFVSGEPGAQPVRITRLTRWEDLQRARALTVTTV